MGDCATLVSFRLDSSVAAAKRPECPSANEAPYRQHYEALAVSSA